MADDIICRKRQVQRTDTTLSLVREGQVTIQWYSSAIGAAGSSASLWGAMVILPITQSSVAIAPRTGLLTYGPPDRIDELFLFARPISRYCNEKSVQL